MMKDELQHYLNRLELQPSEAAQLLGVAPRTLRRWLEDGEEIPGPAKQAILAWIKLHDMHLAWRPDSQSIIANDERSLSAHRDHDMDLAARISRVEARGGANASLWTVDMNRCRASSGQIEVWFYLLQNHGFSIAGYSRKDGIPPDQVRDAAMIDEATYCIAQAFARRREEGSVVLVAHSASPRKGAGSTQQHEEFPTLRAAIERARARWDDADFHEPFIMAAGTNKLLWNTRELRAEVAKVSGAPKALKALAKGVRDNAGFFVRSGPAMLTPEQAEQKRRRIEGLAVQLDDLSQLVPNGQVTYQQFDRILSELHAQGFFPQGELVSDVANAFLSN